MVGEWCNKPGKTEESEWWVSGVINQERQNTQLTQ